MFSYLPLGQHVLKQMEAIIDEHLDSVGAQKMQMPILQNMKRWEDSGRRSLMGRELYSLKDRKGQEYCLSPTNEEVITSIAKELVNFAFSLYSRLSRLIIPSCYIRPPPNSAMKSELKRAFFEARSF